MAFGFLLQKQWRILSEFNPFQARKIMISSTLLIRHRFKGYHCELELIFFIVGSLELTKPNPLIEFDFRT